MLNDLAPQAGGLFSPPARQRRRQPPGERRQDWRGEQAGSFERPWSSTTKRTVRGAGAGTNPARGTTLRTGVQQSV